MVSDAPAAAAAAEMPLVRSAGIELNTAPAAPGAAAPGEEKSVEMSHGAAPATVPFELELELIQPRMAQKPVLPFFY